MRHRMSCLSAALCLAGTLGSAAQAEGTVHLSVEASNDDLLACAATHVDTNYAIPTWTRFQRARAALVRTGSPEAARALRAAYDSLRPKESPYAVVATLNGDPSTRIGFNWLTNAGIAGGKVELVEGRIECGDAFADARSIEATATAWNGVNYSVAANGLSLLAGIPDNSKRSYTVNKALATGLKPNTTYSYRVGREGAWSAIGHFTTARTDKAPFSFLYFTDPQANTDEMFAISAKTLHAAVAKAPGAHFILSSGDLVETSGSKNAEWEYEQFFQTQQDIWNEYPFAPVMGNHDKSTNRNFTRHFNTAVTPFDSAMATVPGSVYSFVQGDALFLAVNYEDYGVAGYLDSLRNWMRRQVRANPEPRWRIAFFHKTMYTGSKSHQSDADGRAVRDSMGPLFDSLHIDLALQGHDHIYEVIGPVRNKALVPGSATGRTTVPVDPRSDVTGLRGGTFDVAGGTLYFLNNSAGKKKYEPRGKAAMDSLGAGLGVPGYFGLFSGRFGQTGEPTFSEIRVSSDSISVSTFTVDDAGIASPFDAFTVVKGKGTTAVGASAASRPLRASFSANGRGLVVNGNPEGRALQVDLLDVRGNRIATATSNQARLVLDVPTLAKGLYLVKVRATAFAKTYKLALD